MALEHFLWTFLISSAPVVELRASLPLALLEYGLPWYYALPTCLAGNLLPVPFLLLLLDPIAKHATRVKWLDRLLKWVFQRTRRQGTVVEKYEMMGLIIFVALPLPGTGAWTGSIMAFLLGLEFRRSLAAIAVGVFIAGIIVTTLSLMGWIGAVVAGIGLVTLAVVGLWRI